MTDKEIERNAMYVTGGDEESARGAVILLGRLWSIAKRRARIWERANNSRAYAESAAHEREWGRIESEREDCEWELRFFYCAEVTWPGLYPVVVCHDGRHIYF